MAKTFIKMPIFFSQAYAFFGKRGAFFRKLQKMALPYGKNLRELDLNNSNDLLYCVSIKLKDIRSDLNWNDLRTQRESTGSQD